MTDGYFFDPAALEGDALIFDGWSTRLDAMEAAIPVDLAPTDFSFIPGAQDVYSSYQKAAGILQAYIRAGSNEMDGFARTLLETVRIYMEAEEFSAADIARVNEEMDEL